MKKKEYLKNKQLEILILALVFIMIFSVSTACGSSSDSSKSSEDVTTDEAIDEGTSAGSSGIPDIATESTTSSDSSSLEGTSDGSTVEDTGTTSDVTTATDSNKKLIKNISYSVETKAFDKLLQKVEAKIVALGGYVESSTTSGNGYYEDNLRTAYLTARIPSDKLEEFASEVEKSSNVISKEESVSDVTLQYVDIESHIKALETEQERILALLEKAETVDDMIALETRLSDVRYQLESYNSQIKAYDNMVEYSTVTISVSEVEKVTPTEEQGVFARIKDGFVENTQWLTDGFVNLFIWFISSLPVLFVIAIWIVIILLVIRFVSKKGKLKSKNNKTDSEKGEKHEPKL